VTQSLRTTIPFKEAADGASGVAPQDGDEIRPRRRLGSWVGASPASLPVGANGDGPTVPLARNDDASATIDLARPAAPASPADATIPFAGPATESEAASAGAATVVLGEPRTTDLPGAPSNGTADLAPSPSAPTVEIEQSTADLAVSAETTRPIGTAELSGDQKLERLRQRVEANPHDSDALFALAVELHRQGHRSQAREALTRLGALYQERGQHAQAARILGMLSMPKTGEIRTQDLPPRPEIPAPTVPLGNTTDRLTGATTKLSRDTAVMGRVPRGVTKTLPVAPLPTFPPESLAFTIPLPGEEELPAEVRELINESAEDLRKGKLQAAHDLCLYALQLAPDFVPLFLRISEIYTAQRLTRRARTQAETLLRLAETSGDQRYLWMIYRVLLHTSENDLTSLRRLVELLIEAGQTDLASFYASKLIQLLDAEGLAEEALGYSVRLCRLIPGDTRAALENVILLLRSGDRGAAVDRWEAAVAAGADAKIAKASMAPIMTEINEDDHWRLLADALPEVREHKRREIVEAYARTAAVLPPSACHLAGHGLLLAAIGDASARDQLAGAAGDRSGSPMARAAASLALASLNKDSGMVDEYVAALRTAVQLIGDSQVASHSAWQGLLGYVPRFEDVSLELGDALLSRNDAAGAVDVLKAAHERSRRHGPLCEKLADAYFRIGQLGSALTVLDELAVHYRNTGQLEAMARVLRHMSQLAPNNIKVKSRLIDAYLQRGFVAEARAELIQRADLEERSGLIKDAVTSLQRAADLSWTMGLAEETFDLYQRMIQLNPNDIGLRHQLVNLYLQMGRVEEAAKHQRAVVDLALAHHGKHEAIAALHQVIGLTPDDTNAYYQLGELLSSIGEYAQAEKVYKRLALINPADPIAQAKATAMAALREGQLANG